jgi:hypothetical protein
MLIFSPDFLKEPIFAKPIICKFGTMSSETQAILTQIKCKMQIEKILKIGQVIINKLFLEQPSCIPDAIWILLFYEICSIKYQRECKKHVFTEKSSNNKFGSHLGFMTPFQ